MQKIEIELKNYRCFQEPIPTKFSLEPGKTIALIGKNNAGKSALLRFFYEFKYPLINFINGNWETVDVLTRKNQNPVDPELNARYGLRDNLDIYPNRDSSNSVKFSFSTSDITYAFEISKPNERVGYQLHKTQVRASSEINFDEKFHDVKDQFEYSLYIGAQRNLITTGVSDYFDLSVGTVFINSWNQLKFGVNSLSASMALKAERLIAELLGWSNLSIDASDDKSQLYLTKDNLHRYSISELGAGISELVICIVTAATRKPSWILIDEPESHLHPSLQVKFVEALTQLASCGLIFTTHSIGLARTCADSILVVQQDKQGRSSIKPFEGINNFSELMGELSFSQFRELGYDKILLCEGVTEVKVFRQILRHWNLDSSVLIVPLGGEALIDANRQHELEEFKRFGVEVFVIVDSERSSEDTSISKRNKFVDVCNKIFGENHAMQTRLRATENYFTSDAIKLALRNEEYQPLLPFQNSKDSPKFWGKNQNWKIAAEMTKEDWEKTDLKNFFERMTSLKIVS
ncbi:ATP-dependent nuclease [Undibacterium sp. TC4M20W]|uniref:ATP-dependent nuclease n=1 Tax=Undibacterium sp. TC4M20W TaxID=3413052 RepID=UPI003BF25E11